MVLSNHRKDIIIIILFLILIITMGFVLHQINDFMPILDTCLDDFEIINKCKCLPGNYTLLFPNG